MPRFETYLDLYPTPQLRRAMRDIYDDFVEFCLSSAGFLSRSVLGKPSPHNHGFAWVIGQDY